MTKKTHAIVSICCFVLTPVYLVIVVLLYDRLATIYQRSDHPFVNLTGLATFFGTAILIIVGIVNAVKAFRKKQ